MARRHMIIRHHRAQLATAAATIRNNGHDNPDAVYSGRGPFTAADILSHAWWQTPSIFSTAP